MRAGVGERQRFHLFEAGAFVTSPLETRAACRMWHRWRFHLFEAGAFVTARLTRQGWSDGLARSVSTYLKLELLSLG